LETQLHLLKQLQEIDSIIGKLERTKAEVPRKLVRLEKEHVQREDRLQKNRSALEKINEERRRKEQKLKTEHDRFLKSQEKVHAVKTNKEYHAVLKEIEDIKRGNGELETEILVCMEESDHLAEELKNQEKEYQQWVQEFKKKKTEFEFDVERSLKDAVELQERRTEIVRGIEPVLISKYELLRQRRQGMAVVAIANDLCQGCNMNIPPQKANELRKNSDSIIYCPFCNRIIYFDGN